MTSKQRATADRQSLAAVWAALRDAGPCEWHGLRFKRPLSLSITTSLDMLVASGRATVRGRVFTAVEPAAEK